MDNKVVSVNYGDAIAKVNSVRKAVQDFIAEKTKISQNTKALTSWEGIDSQKYNDSINTYLEQAFNDVLAVDAICSILSSYIRDLQERQLRQSSQM